MFEQHTRPHWGWLYLIPALGAASFYSIQRLHPSALASDALGIGVLLMLGGYFEAWRRANRYALMHEPGPGTVAGPLYEAREVTPVRGSIVRTVGWGTAIRIRSSYRKNSDAACPAPVNAPAGELSESIGRS